MSRVWTPAGRPAPRAAAYRPASGKPRTVRDDKAAAAHDLAVEGHSEAVLCAMGKDLCGRPITDRRDPEQRWVQARREAVLRRLIQIRRGLK